jgi:hypothetical protein
MSDTVPRRDIPHRAAMSPEAPAGRAGQPPEP